MNMWQRPQSSRPVLYWKPHKRLKWQDNGMLLSWGGMWYVVGRPQCQSPWTLFAKVDAFGRLSKTLVTSYMKHKKTDLKTLLAAPSSQCLTQPFRFPNNGWGGGCCNSLPVLVGLGQGEEVRTCHCAPFVWTLSLGRAAHLGLKGQTPKMVVMKWKFNEWTTRI